MAQGAPTEIIFNFKPSFLIISSKFDNNKTILSTEPIFIKTVKSNNNLNSSNYISRPHLRFLDDLKIPTYNYQRLHGSLEPIIYWDKIKNGKIIDKRKVIYKKEYLK